MIIGIVGGYSLGSLYGFNNVQLPKIFDNEEIIKKTVYAKVWPTGLVTTKIENKTYIASEVKFVGLSQSAVYFDFKSENDTQVRTVSSGLRIGDKVIYQTVTDQMKCESTDSIYLDMPDGYDDVKLNSVKIGNFTDSSIPKYYRERYNIVNDFSACDHKDVNKYVIIVRDGQIHDTYFDRSSYE